MANNVVSALLLAYFLFPKQCCQETTLAEVRRIIIPGFDRRGRPHYHSPESARGGKPGVIELPTYVAIPRWQLQTV